VRLLARVAVHQVCNDVGDNFRLEGVYGRLQDAGLRVQADNHHVPPSMLSHQRRTLSPKREYVGLSMTATAPAVRSFSSSTISNSGELLEAAKPTRLHALFVLALYLGLRRGGVWG
jgi:hypothetical protein